MERLILGIIAVICLHIAYVAYIYTERPLVDTAFSPVPPSSQPRPVAGLDETLERLFPGGQGFSTLGDDDQASALAGGRTLAKRGSDPEAITRAVRRVRRYTPPVDPDEVSDRGPFRSVTIEIPPPYIPKMPVEPDSPAIKTMVRRTENKSFIAGVLPVIKKPYSWLKALGSKLK